ncbi:hypothetical protein PIB30_074367 [Stylosanthes scabra]|uniref:Uncharacterized protein n=1 Tax=Stylosanthes scabra TaxID=79078 RepID=A0ABU6ZNA2_9FABA|nr:hypothetical protein [Stylosanthes scabra]
MELTELVANNQYMFTSDRSVKRGVMEVDTMDALLAQYKAMAEQLTTLNKKMEKLEVAALGTLAEVQTTCCLCGGDAVFSQTLDLGKYSESYQVIYHSEVEYRSHED